MTPTVPAWAHPAATAIARLLDGATVSHDGEVSVFIRRPDVVVELTWLGPGRSILATVSRPNATADAVSARDRDPLTAARLALTGWADYATSISKGWAHRAAQRARWAAALTEETP